MNSAPARLAIAALVLGMAGALQTSVASAADEPAATDRSTPQAKMDTASDQGDPRDYLAFSNIFTSDCMMHRAELRQIANTHPDQTIRVVLWNYTGKTRSQGSSTKILAPDSEPEPLGCDGTAGLKRRWEIESAEFVDADSP